MNPEKDSPEPGTASAWDSSAKPATAIESPGLRASGTPKQNIATAPAATSSTPSDRNSEEFSLNSSTLSSNASASVQGSTTAGGVTASSSNLERRSSLGKAVLSRVKAIVPKSKSTVQNENKELRAIIQRMTNELEQLKVESVAMNKTNQQYNEELQKAHTEAKKFRSEIMYWQQERDVLQQKLVRLQQEYDCCRGECIRLRETMASEKQIWDTHARVLKELSSLFGCGNDSASDVVTYANRLVVDNTALKEMVSGLMTTVEAKDRNLLDQHAGTSSSSSPLSLSSFPMLNCVVKMTSTAVGKSLSTVKNRVGRELGPNNPSAEETKKSTS